MKTVTLHIPMYNMREDMVIALARSGYKVWTATGIYGTSGDEFVCFEIKDSQINNNADGQA